MVTLIYKSKKVHSKEGKVKFFASLILNLNKEKKTRPFSRPPIKDENK